LAELVPIWDPADERVADYAALNDPALRKRYEDRLGVFIAEGPHVVRELVRSRFPTRSLLVTREQVDVVRGSVDHLDVPVYVVERDLLYELVRFRLHQGVLGCGSRLPDTRVDDTIRDARTVVVLEAMNDHENLGTLFRSARGLGVDAVLLAPGCADPLYRRSVRVSMGHVLHLPFARVGPLPAALDVLHDAGFATIALTPRDDARDLADLPRPADRIAILLGAEGPGLADATIEAATHVVRIAMHEGVDSLNVAAAGAVAFHALADRRGRTSGRVPGATPG
jgi:tRNA G18 (ribose-2'-O)-methylase SpoU